MKTQNKNQEESIDDYPSAKAMLVSWKIILVGMNAFFSSVVQMAFGLASMFLLLGLMQYFNQDITLIQGLFLNLIGIIQRNIKFFLLFIFIYEFKTKWSALK